MACHDYMFTRTAKRQIREIAWYLKRSRGDVVASAFIDELEHQVGLVRRFPYMRPLSPENDLAEKGYRTFGVGRYVVLYLVVDARDAATDGSSDAELDAERGSKPDAGRGTEPDVGRGGGRDAGRGAGAETGRGSEPDAGRGDGWERVVVTRVFHQAQDYARIILHGDRA